MNNPPQQPPQKENIKKKIYVQSINDALEMLLELKNNETDENKIKIYNKYIKELNDEINK
jgi:hypothetical protein